jgi:hypothetical protein
MDIYDIEVEDWCRDLDDDVLAYVIQREWHMLSPTEAAKKASTSAKVQSDHAHSLVRY